MQAKPKTTQAADDDTMLTSTTTGGNGELAFPPFKRDIPLAHE